MRSLPDPFRPVVDGREEPLSSSPVTTNFRRETASLIVWH